MKKRNNRSMAKILLAQLAFFAMTFLVIVFSLMVFATALQLFGISDNIHFIEGSGRWTDEAHERYDELIAERIAVKESSLIGYLMVIMGGNFITQALRIIILLGLLLIDCFAIWFCYEIIKEDIKLLLKKIFRKTNKRRSQKH